MCRAVTSPSRTFRGTMMHSRVGLSGSLRFTTNRPSRAIVATFRYRLTSFVLVTFFDGRVPCMRCECVLRKSWQSA